MSAKEEAVDVDVISLAISGDQDARREIYEVFCGRVYRTVCRIVGESDAADVMQETFLHLFDRLASFRHESSFPTWLHRLVVNEALQHLRRKRRRTMKTHPLNELDVADPGPSTWHRDAVELLTKAMEVIEPELRLIFQLKEVDKLSYAQIGEVVGIPEGTVGSRLNRARRELRDQLLKLGWEPSK